MERSIQNCNTLDYKLKYLIEEGDIENQPQISFLEQLEGSISQEKILLTSYPRSGNTLIRSYLEKISKVYTGSDCDTKRKLNRELMEMGMTGEGKINSSVWIVKSHFPERIGHSEFQVNKCIIIVRSPIDCFASLFNMIATSSHNKSINEEDFVKVKEYWNQFVNQEIPAWANFHEYWSQSPQQVPTYFLRYEDLLLDPSKTLKQLFCFLLCREQIEVLRVEKIIDEVVKENQSIGVYKPRSGKINGSYHLYTEDQIKQLKTISGKHLYRFGYLKIKGLENPTGFISEDEGDREESLEKQKEEEKEQKVEIAKWMLDFNNKMMKINLGISVKQELKEKCIKLINKPTDIIRKKSSKDPTARGARPIQSALRKTLFGTDKV